MQTGTYQQWSKLGYRIRKGQRAAEKDARGRPLFSKEQVWYPPVRSGIREPEFRTQAQLPLQSDTPGRKVRHYTLKRSR